jgi:hypothetical protein
MKRPLESNLFDEDIKLAPAQLPFIISLPTMSKSGVPRPLKLTGHTRALSALELELVGPFILFNNRSLLGASATLQLTLGLPTGSISLQATALSYTELDERETGLGYLITAHDDAPHNSGDLNCVIKARITDINEGDHRQLVKYLRSLHQNELEQTILVLDTNGRWQEQTLTVTVMA